MTDEEMQKVTDLLVAGRTIGEIAEEIGYSKENVRSHIKAVRKARSVPYRVRQMWVARILAGRADMGMAAKTLGVRRKDVVSWIREDGADR